MLTGKIIRDARTKAKITQNQLAQQTGISQQQISKIEAGNVDDVGIKTLNKIAESLKIDLSEFKPKSKNQSFAPFFTYQDFVAKEEANPVASFLGWNFRPGLNIIACPAPHNYGEGHAPIFEQLVLPCLSKNNNIVVTSQNPEKVFKAFVEPKLMFAEEKLHDQIQQRKEEADSISIRNLEIFPLNRKNPNGLEPWPSPLEQLLGEYKWSMKEVNTIICDKVLPAGEQPFSAQGTELKSDAIDFLNKLHVECIKNKVALVWTLNFLVNTETIRLNGSDLILSIVNTVVGVTFDQSQRVFRAFTLKDRFEEEKEVFVNMQAVD